MSGHQVTVGGKALDPGALQPFQASLRGRLLRPGDEEFDAARVVWNRMIDRRPCLIARCTGAADVLRAVNFARTHDLLVAVRGGGHNVAGNAVCDDGLVVDLSLMKGMRVDPVARTVHAQAGLTWGELNDEIQAFGLAATGGYVSTTGIAGLTLGGGLGWLVRKYGLACDNLLSVDVVTADGRFLTASAEQNEDLFWGLRGGGGNFGIATSFEYRIHPLDTVLGGMVLHPAAKAREVLQFYRDFTAAAPDEVTTGAVLLTAPDVGPVIAIALCYAGSQDAGEPVVRPLRAFGPPVADLLRPMAYMEVQTMVDATWPPGYQNYWRSHFLSQLSDPAIETIMDHFAAVPSPRSAVVIEHLGGAVSRVAEEETAFGHRGWPYNLLITAVWDDPADAAANIQWTRTFGEAMQPFGPGAVYVNYMGEEGQERIRAAYGANYERLVALKDQYDPQNLFRLNQNIPPTGRSGV